MYKALMSVSTMLAETQLVLLCICAATVDSYQEHRTAHAALGVAGSAYVEPTVTEQLGWLNTDPTLVDCMTDLKTAISDHHSRYKITNTVSVEMTAR